MIWPRKNRKESDKSERGSVEDSSRQDLRSNKERSDQRSEGGDLTTEKGSKI